MYCLGCEDLFEAKGLHAINFVSLPEKLMHRVHSCYSMGPPAFAAAGWHGEEK